MTPDTSFPDTARLGHVGLNVTDLDRSLAFYQRILALQALRVSWDPGRRFAFLGRDGSVLLTLWEQADEPFAAGRAGLHHLAFELDDLASVRAAQGRAEEAGARIHHGGVVPHADSGGSGGLFFEDPDGTRLEVYTRAGVEEAPAPTPGAPTCGFF